MAHMLDMAYRIHFKFLPISNKSTNDGHININIAGYALCVINTQGLIENCMVYVGENPVNHFINNIIKLHKFFSNKVKEECAKLINSSEEKTIFNQSKVCTYC